MFANTICKIGWLAFDEIVQIMGTSLLIGVFRRNMGLESIFFIKCFNKHNVKLHLGPGKGLTNNSSDCCGIFYKNLHRFNIAHMRAYNCCQNVYAT